MMDGDWSGWGWGWMMLMPLLWILLIGAIVWAVVRLAHPGGHRDASARAESAKEVLDRRYASGEIDEETYQRMSERLAKGGRP
ncbi:hypothetical protein L0U85_00925 [Glycomyces sp. L485]|uniref:SHOCT domain-containing protein n=1 Tax=Glycomyces sp. L485 TaxID=2909235 RepID=UPI001F4ADAA0|nr:hypothetical protein [Glycomyces sp. L485]MCH7229430.1 hypothetical protein [Glycomyces sp. L485]